MPASPSSSPRRRASCEAARDVVDVQGIDEHRSPAGHVLGAGAVRGHHGGALRHRLQHRQAEALAQARVGQGLRTGVEGAQLVGRHEAECPDVAAGDGHVTPAARSGQDQLEVGVLGPDALERRDQAGQVLAGLDRAGEQDVGPVEAELLPGVGHLLGRGPLGTHAQRYEAQPCFADAVRREIGPRGHRRAQHQVGVAAQELETPVEGPQPAAREVVGLVEERQVVHGHDQRGRSGRDDASWWHGRRRPARSPARPSVGAARATPRRARSSAAAANAPARPVGTASGGGPRWAALTPTTSTSPRSWTAATTSSAATAVPPGTRCQHCSRVTAARTADHPGRRRRRSMVAR